MLAGRPQNFIDKAMATLPPGSRALYRICAERSRIDFGQYSGLLVGDILKINPSYIGYLYYNYDMLSFKAEILEAAGIEELIPKPGKSEDAWNRYKSKLFHEETDGMTSEEKFHRRMHLQKVTRLRAQGKAINAERENNLSRAVLQSINHGHITKH